MKLLPLLLSLVLISGCIQQPGGSGGIVIEAFQPDFPSVYSNELIRLRVEIRNTGTQEGEIRKIELIGLPENFKVSNTCQDLFDANIHPSNPWIPIPGEPKTCYFEVKAPELPEEATPTYYPKVRVTYSYSSVTLQSVTVGTDDEIRQFIERGASLPSDVSSVTSSPIQINLGVRSPLRVYETDVSFPMEITVSNIGGGVPCAISFGEFSGFARRREGLGACDNAENFHRILVLISGPISGECVAEHDISLWRGTNTIKCNARTDFPYVGRVQKVIKAESIYDYFVERETSFTVTGLNPSF